MNLWNNLKHVNIFKIGLVKTNEFFLKYAALINEDVCYITACNTCGLAVPGTNREMRALFVGSMSHAIENV